MEQEDEGDNDDYRILGLSYQELLGTFNREDSQEEDLGRNYLNLDMLNLRGC